ncbi:MAG TPA: 1-acyl-sn-glycerol-3-phosphate acyltransferase [Luteibaculaceae bacterium]|nr:1-acyl-sn-glycerol-3-phosphate acyltransferase [Luteibaculaceae bacterium]
MNGTKPPKPSSVAYTLVKAWVGLGLRIFFRNIEVRGKENIPPRGPLIFAVNHPNTVLDALLVTCTNKRNSWFLARGDVFNRPFLAALFRRLRMFPVFRQRDGNAKIKNNTEVFSQLAQWVQRGEALIIFPEGSHNRNWNIRPFGKGMARIAADAATTQQPVMIVPVGLTYFDPESSFSDVLVQYGTPIAAKHTLQGDPKAQNELTANVQQAMMELSLHISGDYDAVFERVKRLIALESDKDTLWEDFIAIKNAIARCEADLELGSTDTEETTERLSRGGWSILSLLVTSPLWLYGKLFTLFPQLLIWIINRRVSDRHFHATVRFGVGLGIYTLLVPGLFIYFSKVYITLFWWLASWMFTIGSMFYVMLWEEHFEQITGRRFMRY